MSGSEAFLASPRYVLGETEQSYATVEHLAARHAIRPVPHVWGWGSYFSTGDSPVELAITSGNATLDAAGIARESVDGLIVCTTAFPPSVDDHGEFLDTVLSGLNLTEVSFAYGMTLNRCNNLLAALHVARSLVAAGSQRLILVVTADRIKDETHRLEKFALFSDGAASCLVSASELGPDNFAILASASAQKADALRVSDRISSQLAITVNEKLERATGIPREKVDALLPANLVLPVLTMKERQAGFTLGQLRTGNVERLGHCFAADPVINLVDLIEAGETETDGLYQLASSVPGARHSVLLRKIS